MISDCDLIVWSEQGLIPGPQEEEEEFFARVLSWKRHGRKKEGKENIPKEDFLSAHRITKALFGFSCVDIEGYYGDEKLSLWQGAALWSCQDETGQLFPVIQARQKFRSGSLYRYSRDEVLSHELVHAARFAFNEPRFEEIFAYRTSKQWIRKMCGPLFQEPWEALVFMLSFLIGMLAFWYNVIMGPHPFSMLLTYIPFVVFICFFLRLLFMQSVFALCKRKIKSFLNEPKRALAFMLRLTDREIFQSAFRSKDKTLVYFLKNQRSSLRIRSIYLTYLRERMNEGEKV